MKLEPEGKKRLESMTKTLAAGLPLAGLLATAAVTGTVAQGCSSGAVMGKMPAPPTEEEWGLDGDAAAPKTLLWPEEVTVTAGLIAMPEAPPIPAPQENPEPPESPPAAQEGATAP